MVKYHKRGGTVQRSICVWRRIMLQITVQNTLNIQHSSNLECNTGNKCHQPVGICWYLNKIFKIRYLLALQHILSLLLEDSSKLKANFSLLFKSQFHPFVLLPYKCQLCSQVTDPQDAFCHQSKAMLAIEEWECQGNIYPLPPFS